MSFLLSSSANWQAEVETVERKIKRKRSEKLLSAPRYSESGGRAVSAKGTGTQIAAPQALLCVANCNCNCTGTGSKLQGELKNASLSPCKRSHAILLASLSFRPTVWSLAPLALSISLSHVRISLTFTFSLSLLRNLSTFLS